MKRLVLATIFLIGAMAPAWAYLDPGTGSMILQGAAAAFAAAAGAFTLGWHRIKMTMSRFLGKKDAPEKGRDE